MAIELSIFFMIGAVYFFGLVLGWFISGQPRIYLDMAFLLLVSLIITFFSLVVIDESPTLGYIGIVISGLSLTILGIRVNQTYTKPIKRVSKELEKMNEEKNFSNLSSMAFISSYDVLKNLVSTQTNIFQHVTSSIEVLTKFESQIDKVLNVLDKLADTLDNDITITIENIDESLQFAIIGNELSEKIQEIVNQLTQEYKLYNYKLSKDILATDKISDQTNLVAVNAAIEAARSDATGENFAIVADGIQRLSTRSRDTVTNLTQSSIALRKIIEGKLNLISSEFSNLDETLYKIAEQSDKVSQITHNQQIISVELKNQLYLLKTRREELANLRNELSV